MKTSRNRNALLTLALGIAVAGILAGPAQARPDDLEGTLSYSRDNQTTQVSPVADKLVDGRIAHAAFAMSAAPDLVDGWAFQYTAGATSTIPNVPDGRAIRSAFGGGAQVVPVSADDGIQIDWRDAGLGALGGAALLALMTFMLSVIRRHDRTLAAS